MTPLTMSLTYNIKALNRLKNEQEKYLYSKAILSSKEFLYKKINIVNRN